MRLGIGHSSMQCAFHCYNANQVGWRAVEEHSLAVLCFLSCWQEELTRDKQSWSTIPEVHRCHFCVKAFWRWRSTVWLCSFGLAAILLRAILWILKHEGDTLLPVSNTSHFCDIYFSYPKPWVRKSFKISTSRATSFCKIEKLLLNFSNHWNAYLLL